MSFRAEFRQEIREAAAGESTRALITTPFRYKVLFSAAARSERPTLAVLPPGTELVTTALRRLGSPRVGLAAIPSRFGLLRPRPEPAESHSSPSSSSRVHPGHVHHHRSLLRVRSRQERSRTMCVLESRWRLPREGDEGPPQREVRRLWRMTIRMSRTSPRGRGESTCVPGSDEMLTTGPGLQTDGLVCRGYRADRPQAARPARSFGLAPTAHTHNRGPPRLSLGAAPSSSSCSTTSCGAESYGWWGAQPTPSDERFVRVGRDREIRATGFVETRDVRCVHLLGMPSAVSALSHLLQASTHTHTHTHTHTRNRRNSLSPTSRLFCGAEAPLRRIWHGRVRDEVLERGQKRTQWQKTKRACRMAQERPGAETQLTCKSSFPFYLVGAPLQGGVDRTVALELAPDPSAAGPPDELGPRLPTTQTIASVDVARPGRTMRGRGVPLGQSCADMQQGWSNRVPLGSAKAPSTSVPFSRPVVPRPNAQ